MITNNHFEGKAVANALMLKAGISGESTPAPPDLFHTYRDALQGIVTVI